MLSLGRPKLTRKKKLFKRAKDLKSKGIGTKIDISYFL